MTPSSGNRFLHPLFRRRTGAWQGCTGLQGQAFMPTLFQRIIAREIPARIEHEDEHCLVIHDIQPQAPVHLLLIPKTLIARVGAAQPEHQAVLGHLLLTAGVIARRLGLDDGFRLVINHGPHGGETVPHLHVHLLGGRPLAWPPG
jgi:histidine triad (HIT) family protein